MSLSHLPTQYQTIEDSLTLAQELMTSLSQHLQRQDEKLLCLQRLLLRLSWLASMHPDCPTSRLSNHLHFQNWLRSQLPLQSECLQLHQ